MSGWSLAAAAVLGGLTLSGVQQPDVTVRAEPIRDALSVASAPNIQERVSASFNQASVREVLDWLSKNGVSFVIADGELSKDATVTLNIRNQPASDVADAIAEALGGHWQRRGEIRVFRKGHGNFAFANPGVSMAMPGLETFRPGAGGGNFYRFDSPAGEKMRTEVRRLEELGKVQGMDGEKMRVESRRLMEELAKVQPKMNMQGPEGEKMRVELRRSMDALGKELPKIRMEALKSLKDHKLSETEQKRIKVEIEKAMAGAHKDMEKARLEIERARKEHPEAFVDGHRVFVSPHGDMSLFVAPEGDGKKVYEYRIDGQRSGNLAPRLRMLKPGGEAVTVGPIADGGLEKLAKALSPDQKDLHRRQGFLKSSDLTPNQRKMLGIKSDKGRWTIKFVKDNDELVIKSDD